LEECKKKVKVLFYKVLPFPKRVALGGFLDVARLSFW